VPVPITKWGAKGGLPVLGWIRKYVANRTCFAGDMFYNVFIKENVLADILSKHRLEVTQVLLTEYDEELHIKNEKAISYNEGYKAGLKLAQQELLEKQGRQEQLIESIKALMENLGITAEEAMKALGIDQASYEKYLKLM